MVRRVYQHFSFYVFLFCFAATSVAIGVVLALFLTLPYGKFVHTLYRFVALVQYAGERRRGAFVEQLQRR